AKIQFRFSARLPKLVRNESSVPLRTRAVSYRADGRVDRQPLLCARPLWSGHNDWYFPHRSGARRACPHSWSELGNSTRQSLDFAGSDSGARCPTVAAVVVASAVRLTAHHLPTGFCLVGTF